jgi:hypothetical protein
MEQHQRAAQPLGLKPATYQGERDAYAGCEIVEVEVVSTEKLTHDADVYRGNLRQAKLAKLQAKATRIPKCPSCRQPLNTHQCKG